MSKKVTIVVSREGMGDGDRSLQLTLVESFFKILDTGGIRPFAICFYADGVKLTVTESPILEILKSLESKGVPMYVCSTCLNHYELMDDLQVGIAGKMTDIMDAQWQADKVITI